MISASDVIDTHHFDTSHWRAIFDFSPTLKQARKANNGVWIKLDEIKCREALAVFLHRLDKAAYGHAAERFGKRVKVIPVTEKEGNGRLHIHAALELPAHIDAVRFDELVRNCWSKVDWSYDRMVFRDKANTGWIDYMLKRDQKSGLQSWSDCIVWEVLHNPPVGA